MCCAARAIAIFALAVDVAFVETQVRCTATATEMTSIHRAAKFLWLKRLSAADAGFIGIARANEPVEHDLDSGNPISMFHQRFLARLIVCALSLRFFGLLLGQGLLSNNDAVLNRAPGLHCAAGLELSSAHLALAIALLPALDV